MRQYFLAGVMLIAIIGGTNAQALMLTTFSSDTYDVVAIGPASFDDNDTLLMNTL